MSTVTTVAELTNALATTGTLNIEVAQSIDVPSGTTFKVQDGVNATVTINEGVTITAPYQAFTVEDGGSLTLKGTGTIKSTSKETKAAVSIKGSRAKLTIDGVTIDVFSANGKDGNYAYGVYASDGASVTMLSGTIKAAYGSGLSTNNTTGGSAITIKGGSILCDGSYAIYNAAYSVIRITGGTVQGINARMGELYISGDAKIIGTTLTNNDYDDIGANVSTSGCIWLGDTIALVMGTYTDPNGTDMIVKISDDAKVSSNFRSAIGIYMVDTKQPSKISVNVDTPANVTTSDPSYEAIRTYDHAYIAAAAQAAGKSFSPVVDSTIAVTTEKVDDYKDLYAKDLKAIADANAVKKSKEKQVKDTVTAIIERAKTVASLGGYETTIPFNAFSIQWNGKYGNEIVNRLKELGYSAEFTFYSASLTMIDGIHLKWK